MPLTSKDISVIIGPMSERIANQMVIYELNPEEARVQLRRVVQENVLGGRVCGIQLNFGDSNVQSADFVQYVNEALN